ncbi:MAG TPA: maleylpyruvate isomerase family mycothiol-dependent enzyme [Acidimicrobiia bacterium]|nr:maleylpyruvate isomerase family mycothiol-dependent enzyme [Acidimicrobiia bacterium]
MTQGAVILVEGDSDRIALETLAGRLGRDLAAEGVEIISMGGVTNVGAYLERFAARLDVVVMCDDRESASVRRAAARAGVIEVRVEVCVADLEDELIRALGHAAVERLIDAEDELGAFRSLQQMPSHRGRAPEQQLRRFVGTKSGRKARYARLLVDALDLERAPEPLMGALAVARAIMSPVSGESPRLVVMPIVDVNPMLGPEREALVDVLSSLRPEEWDTPTECPAWTVAGVALHVLGDDLSLLARQRDAAVDGLTLFAKSRPDLDFRQRLDGFNEQWVTAASFLSERLMIELLEMTGRETAAFYRDVDVDRLGEPVGLFAGIDASPYWQISAREFLERWIHQHQIRRALGGPNLGREFLTTAGAVVAHMIAAHARLLGLDAGTSVVFEIGDIAGWTVQVDDGGAVVYVGGASSPDLRVALEAAAATAVLSRGLHASDVPSKLRVEGAEELRATLVQGFAALAGRP